MTFAEFTNCYTEASEQFDSSMNALDMFLEYSIKKNEIDVAKEELRLMKEAYATESEVDFDDLVSIYTEGVSEISGKLKKVAEKAYKTFKDFVQKVSHEFEQWKYGKQMDKIMKDLKFKIRHDKKFARRKVSYEDRTELLKYYDKKEAELTKIWLDAKNGASFESVNAKLDKIDKKYIKYERKIKMVTTDIAVHLAFQDYERFKESMKRAEADTQAYENINETYWENQHTVRAYQALLKVKKEMLDENQKACKKAIATLKNIQDESGDLIDTDTSDDTTTESAYWMDDEIDTSNGAYGGYIKESYSVEDIMDEIDQLISL